MSAKTISTKSKSQKRRPANQRTVNQRPANQHRPATGLFPEVNRTELAARIGCDLSHLSYILKGRREPRSELFMKLAAALKVSTANLGAMLQQARADYQKAAAAGVPAAQIKVVSGVSDSGSNGKRRT